MDKLIEILKKNSVSGFENELTKFIFNEFNSADLVTEISKMGNVKGFKKGKKDLTILIDAHYDQIGFVVQKIEKNGFIRIKNIGGIDTKVLHGLELKIMGKEEIRGIVVTKPPHLLKPEDHEKTPRLSEILLDTGMEPDLLKDRIEIGDPIVFSSEPINWDGYVAGAGIDNKGGVYVLLKLAEFLKNYSTSINVILRATVLEEFNSMGAACEIKEKYSLAIVLDATYAKQHLVDEAQSFSPEDGPCLMYGPNYSLKYNEIIENIAKTHSIKFQREVDESVRGTNAFRYATLSGGHPVVGISYPAFNMHTPYEIVKRETLNSIVHILKLFIEGGGEQ